MKYYFEIQTSSIKGSGISTDFTIQFSGEKGDSNSFSLDSAIGKKQISDGEKLSFSVESTSDVGCANKITLTNAEYAYLINGWRIDDIKISKSPLSDNGQISVFNINDCICGIRESKSYEVSSGYPLELISDNYRFDEEVEGFINVPANVHYSKTVSTELSITVNKSTIRTKDTSTGGNINLSGNAISAMFDSHINNMVQDTLDVTVNTVKQYTDTIDIDGGDEPIVYEVLWSKKVYTFDVQVGEVEVTFEIPSCKLFSGLRQKDTGCTLKAEQVQNRPVFNYLAIAMTRKCTAACKMCCFECSPEREEELPPELLFRLIDEAGQIGCIKTIGFAGGEAMTRPELVIQCIKKTTLRGMLSTLSSNGYWASTYDKAKYWMGQMKAAGLGRLTVSVDEYHQEYIPIENIRNIIAANHRTNLQLTLAVGDSPEKKDAASMIRELGTDIYEVNLIVYPFSPVGGGKNLEHILLRPVDDTWTCSNQQILSVFYDGTVYPCCSQNVYKSLLGEKNISNESLREIIEFYTYNSIYAALTHHNFNWLKRKAEEWSVPVGRESHSVCSLCNELFTNESFVTKFKKYILEERIEYAMETINQQKENDLSTTQRNIEIHGKTYTLNVVKSTGGNPTSVKLLTQDRKSYAFYNGKVAYEVYEGEVMDTAKKLFQDLPQSKYSDFPNNMPRQIKLELSGKTYAFTRRQV